MGERLVFNMPYQTLLKIAAAKTVEIKMDAVRFELDETHKQAIRDFIKHIRSLSALKAVGALNYKLYCILRIDFLLPDQRSSQPA